jgi:serine/threonine protein kinase
VKDDEKISDLLLRWEEAQERGEDLAAEILCADCPELIEPVRKRIAALRRMDWMTRPRPDEPDPKVGTTLAGRYRIDELIGEGGHGKVYRGFDPELQRPVAIKLPNDRKLNTSDLLEEARKVARLRHPGIVTVYDVGQHEGEPFIVSDFVSGTTLCEAGPFTPQVAAHLVAEIAESLHAAHEQGFAHRDIKPANILIDQQGRPLLTDFGIATASGESSVLIAGTLPYMAPEQLGDDPAKGDPRTDIWSLGVVLYELLTGKLPFDDPSPAKLSEQIRTHVPLPPRGINSDIPPALEAVVLKCLAKAPEERYETAHQLAHALRNSRRRRSMVRSAVVVLLTVGIAGLIAFQNWDRWFGPNPSNASSPESKAEPTALRFIGGAAIHSPVERFAPCTLEAWVRPDEYREGCQFIIGSDVPGEFGIGIGICGENLTYKYLSGLEVSKTPVPLRRWSHVAAVFGKSDTKLFLNGQLVWTGPATRNEGGTNFVVGRVGEISMIDEYHGFIRSVRISRRARYSAAFIPEDSFKPDDTSVLIYDGENVESLDVFDVSGNGNDGKWVPVEAPH